MNNRVESIQWTAGPLRQWSRSLSASLISSLVCAMDALTVLVTGIVAYVLYVGVDPVKNVTYAALITVYALMTVQLFYFAELYKLGAIAQPVRYLRRIVYLSSLLFLVTVTFLFALKISDQFSRVWTFSWLVASMTLIVLGRLVACHLLTRAGRSGMLTRNVVIVGASEQAEKFISHLSSAEEPWIRIEGIFDDRGERVEATVANVPVRGNVDDLIRFVREHRVDDILVALPWSAERRIQRLLTRLKVLPVHIGLSPDLVALNFIPCTTTDLAGAPVLNVVPRPLSGWRYALKLVEDRLLGVGIFLLILPLLALIALIIKLDSPGPVFFRQVRQGFNNKLIRVFKFRTMYVDQQDDNAEKLTEPGDARVTRIGALLRKTSLDELPQFINVLRGDMSIVGPRPHALRARAGDRLYPEVVADYFSRHRVKPGITGWAQVNGWRGLTDTYEKLVKRVEHDIHYIENWSFLLDLKIIARTVWICLRGQNAY